jgi:hypothetical protein
MRGGQFLIFAKPGVQPASICRTESTQATKPRKGFVGPGGPMLKRIEDLAAGNAATPGIRRTPGTVWTISTTGWASSRSTKKCSRLSQPGCNAELEWDAAGGGWRDRPQILGPVVQT